MKTNLINLMTLVKEQEMEYKDSCYTLANYSKNRNAIEVTNQQTKSLEDNDVLTKADVDGQQYLSLLDTYIIDCGGAV